MTLYDPRLLVLLFALLLGAMVGRADSPQPRSPQDLGDDDTSLHFYTPTPSVTGTASEPTSSVTFELGDVPDMSVCGRSSITCESRNVDNPFCLDLTRIY